MTETDHAVSLRFGDRKERGLWRRFRFYLQDHPKVLERLWRLNAIVLRRMRRPVEILGAQRASRWIKPVEELVKRPIFDCQMCGQCILHSTGMTCPMTCPKQLRNGPCGGVRMNGHCEVYPEMRCVWVTAVSRAPRTGYSDDLGKLNPPVDWQLQGISSWVTFALGRDVIITGSGKGPHHASEVLS